MRLPPKLTHGDNLANLFEKFNTVIDYLRETRLVPGPGIRINHIAAGISIESTATATGGSPATPPQGHPFDVQLINKGTEENPDYYVRIYDSSMPDSPYAGIIIIYDWSVYVPVTEVKVTTQDRFYVVLDITYTGSGDPPFSIPFSLLPYGSGSDVGYLTQREYIAQGKIPNVASRMSGNIVVNNRWA